MDRELPKDGSAGGATATTEPASPALLFEMLRSFVTLARTLNLSHAVKELNSTRQTLRRHIASLEALKGGTLFAVNDRRYVLTPFGEKVLPEARDLVLAADGWLRGYTQRVNGLQLLRHEMSRDWWFHLQQHPINRAFTAEGRMLAQVIAGWAEAEGALEHEGLRAVRRYCNVFRRVHDNLIFTEVGEDSSYVSWFGEKLARSTIGREIGEMPGGDGFGHLVNLAYREIENSQSIRLDHICSVLPKGESGENMAISYQRLLMGARFPDDSPAILSVVYRTYDIDIEGVGEDFVRRMPADALM
jgi:hypothetical protein